MAESTFSESWYRIANQRISLRPGIRVQRQNFRGERWIVLENPFSNQYFRLRPAAYEFIARLRPDKTVHEVWRECLDRFPDEAPGQESVIQLLSQLYFANLLQYDLAADSAQLFERYKQRRQREFRARFLNLMFMRFPLIDPDRFLVKTLPVVGKLITPVFSLVWLAVVALGLKVVIDNFPALRDQSQSLLAPDNLFLLYVGLVIVKTLHEFGHAYFCRKFGGEVHTMGVMLLIFTPLPYMDATSSWGIRIRWKRILVGGAGMIVEVFVAALAAFVWAKTGSGTVHNLAYNMMFVASVSTILFNINPLLRFDGYYILSDLLEIPNLHQRAGQHFKHLTEHYAFGVKQSESPAVSQKEAGWLTGFGIASWVYRIFVFSAILLFVADRFLLLGLIMVAICLIGWLIVPLGKLVHYLATSPRLARNRARAIGVTIGVVGGVLAFLNWVPFPYHFRAPGILEVENRSVVVNETAGIVKEVVTDSGEWVDQGEPLLRLRNPELTLRLSEAKGRSREVEARLREALNQDFANLEPLRSLLGSVTQRVTELEKDTSMLTIRAAHAGRWVAPDVGDYLGRWVVRGSRLGQLIDPSSFQFTAVVMQTDVDRLFSREIPKAEVRLYGEAATNVPIGPLAVIPAEKRRLPSPALGWLGGGGIAVAQDDPEGTKTTEPFFEVHATVKPGAPVAMLHGRSGKIRFDIGSKPLLPRWIRRFRQLLQRRYQL